MLYEIIWTKSVNLMLKEFLTTFSIHRAQMSNIKRNYGNYKKGRLTFKHFAYQNIFKLGNL